jgi:hypothetical protein
MSARKVTCIITGSSYVFSTEYYKKKVAEYKDEDNLKKYFILKLKLILKFLMLLAKNKDVKQNMIINKYDYS